MTTTSTPTDSGTGLNDAQAKITALLTAAEGDNQEAGDDEAALPDDEAEDAEESSEDLEDTPDQGEPGDDDEELESEDAQEDDDATRAPETIEIDGTPVALEEVKKGYLRQSDYTRKTQALAEERKAFDEHSEGVRVERAQYAQLLTALEAQLAAGDEQEPDWDVLYAQDPLGAVKLERQHRVRNEQRQQRQQAILAERQRLAEVAEKEQGEHIVKLLTGEREALVKAIPAWKDPAVAKAEREKVKKFAQSIGFTEDELSQVTDHRAIVGLRLAMKYSELAAKRQQGTPAPAAKVRPMRPGAVPAKGDSRRGEYKQAQQRLAKSGNVRDAAKSLEFLI